MAKAKTKDDIHELAKTRFQEILDYEGNEREIMEDDKAFSLGEDNAQWEPDDVTSRSQSGRSFLTIMRSNQFTDHIKNQQRQNKPAIKISPTDEGAQEEVATLRQGLVRHIQYESKASMARQIAFDDAVDEGRGHWIVKTDYVEGTFNKKITIDPIENARSVYMDIHRQRPDYSDCEYGFVITPIQREVFEDKYPKAMVESWDSRESDFWWTEKDVMIAEYYCKEYKTRNLIEVEMDGETRILWEDELEVEKDSLNVINERQVEDPYWMWYKMTGAEIIDDEELPWKEIPIITTIGKENNVGGHWSCKGLIRDIKQPLRLYNFVASNEADIIAKAPRAPWIGAVGQFETNEDDWAASNTTDHPYIEYDPVTVNGTLAPPPQRAQFSVDLHNLTQEKMAIIEDIKAITGIYDASVGNRSNETSGVAIRAREAQGNNANYHFIDNFAMGINHEGRVINSALNVIYDTDRTITIMGEDDEEALQRINGPDGKTLGEGNFNVTVSVGPSFNTQREEQAAGMMEMLTGVPLVQNVAPDLVVRSQDWVGKDALADRLEYAVEQQIPGITTQSKPEGKNEELAFAQQQLNQCKQQLQQMEMQGQQLQEALQKADADKQAAEAGKIQIEMQKLEIEKQKVQLDGMKIQGDLKIAERQIEIDAMKADLDSETKLKIADDSNQVELIKSASQTDSDIKKIEKSHEVSEKSKEADKVKVTEQLKKGFDAEIANIKALIEAKSDSKGEKKKTVVKKLPGGGYTFESVSSDGEKTVGTVKEKKDGYVVESKETNGKSQP